MGNIFGCCRRPPPIHIVKLCRNVRTPTRATRSAAGLDLYSPADYVIPAHRKRLLPTGLAVKVPINCYGRIAPKSGLANKSHLHVGAGVVDKDYQGEVHVLLYNFGPLPQVIKKGRPMAQLICERIEVPRVVLVQHLGEVSERGTRGWGSGIQLRRMN